jgi:uracil-DNA glycosylase
LLSSALIAASRQVKTTSMDMRANSDLTEQIAAALDWWREAGVDGELLDAPQRWITPPEPEKAPEPAAKSVLAPPPPAPPAPPPQLDRSTWPQDLDAFASWWLAEAWLDDGRSTGRVPPRGATGAPLMVLVAEPEREDSDVLLSGPQGRLLGAILTAMGIAEDAAYIASLLPRAMPHADWSAVAAQGLGDVARHHVALAAPQRLIVFGSHILPLLGHDPAQNPATSAQFQHGDLTLPMLAARDLALLLERPRWKAAFWQNWLDWTGNT